MLVKDIAEFTADSLLFEIISRRGDDDYEMYIFGKLLVGGLTIKAILEKYNLLEQVLDDKYLEIVVKVQD